MRDANYLNPQLLITKLYIQMLLGRPVEKENVTKEIEESFLQNG
jgi:hypothetical protein